MSFTAGSGSLTVTAPPNSNIAPPGYYMLFLINNNGVPSVASFVLLNGSGGGNPAPTVSSVSPRLGIGRRWNRGDHYGREFPVRSHGDLRRARPRPTSRS